MARDEAYGRYVSLNLPHARTIVARIWRSLEAQDALTETGDTSATTLGVALSALEEELRPFDEDPPIERALQDADRVAERGRDLVAAIVASPARGDRLGQSVRNLFECLGLAEELSLIHI